ncbi:hypothetical protein ACIGG9_16840 [Pseudonocardia alni]|uniref:8-oxoguanine DNA glycosylase OGG fold protein n=1 Tax=Pseudonocardia alni TaxID=33907 RepID=UPI00340516C4
MNDVPGIPEALKRRYIDWIGRRSPAQLAIPWNRETWTRWLDRRDDLVVLRNDDLLDLVSRDSVTGVFRKVGTERSIVDAFVAAMIWGYGPVGYGPYRTHRVLAVNRDPAARLNDVLVHAAAGDVESAFRAARAPGLKHLGPAFGTKFLYFCSLLADRADAICPVLDSVVASWFRDNTDFHPRVDVWRWDDYRRYLATLHAWSAELDGLRIDHIEQLIFDSTWESERPAPGGDDIPSALLRIRELLSGSPTASRERYEVHLDALDDLASEDGLTES